ncbi:MAG: phosphoglycerate kinase [Patescibacteria group bacterium]
MLLPLLKDAPWRPGLHVLVRADFDVAMDGSAVADASRIEAALPTIRFLLARKVKVRLLAHRGRPGGMKHEELSLAPVAQLLSRVLGCPVPFVSDPLHGSLPDADIVLFENLRFWPGEEHNDPAFAEALAAHGEAYVNEAFAACHRAHASLVPLARLLPAYAGLHLAEEVVALERVLERPPRPLVAGVGGVKMETKLPLIRRFLGDADRVIVGGAIANTLFALQGGSVGRSMVDTAGAADISFLRDAKLFLPFDVVAVDRLAPGAAAAVRARGEVKADEYIADIGPKSREVFSGLLRGAKTVVWNGPMGYAEAPEFAEGTIAVARAIQKTGAFTIVGGGDTVAALRRHDVLAGFSHVSTGGGAMLEFLSGKKLPGLEVFRKQ